MGGGIIYFKMRKKIYFLTILLLGLTFFWEVGSFLDREEKKQSSSLLPTPSPVIQLSSEANYGEIKLRLLSSKPLKANQDFEVKLTIESPQVPIVGSDIILIFDPQIVAFKKAIFNQNLFEQNIVNAQKQEEGKIKITSYSPIISVIKTNNLADLTFRLLKNEPTQIKVYFEKEGSLNDSNLISEEKKDILKNGFVLNLNQNEK